MAGPGRSRVSPHDLLRPRLRPRRVSVDANLRGRTEGRISKRAFSLELKRHPSAQTARPHRAISPGVFEGACGR